MIPQKVALVTGGSRGIGRAISVELAKAGYALLINFNENLGAAEEAGFRDASYEDKTVQLVHHSRRVLEETTERTAELLEQVSEDYIERMKAGLRRWIEGGQAGHLAWGIFLVRKP